MEFELSLSFFILIAIFVVSEIAICIVCSCFYGKNKHRGREALVMWLYSSLLLVSLAGIMLVIIWFFDLDSFAVQTKRIASIYATSTDGQNIHLVCGEDGVQGIKILGMDTEAGTATCEYKKDGTSKVLNLGCPKDRPIIVSAERWGHKDGIWRLRVKTDTFVSFVCDEGTSPHFDVWAIEKNLDEPGLSKSTNYTFTLESGYTVNWDDPEAPVIPLAKQAGARH